MTDLTLLFLDQHNRTSFDLRVLERPNPLELVLEWRGIDASFVNAIRRILLAEVPTMALEHVYMWQNSSILHDEVLAHRIGLVPLNVDARRFDEMETNDEDENVATDRNTLVFKLAVKCTAKDAAADAAAKSAKKKTTTTTGENVALDADDDDNVLVGSKSELSETAAAAAAAHFKQAIQTPERPYTKHVYSRDLIWVPQGDQATRFEEIKPVHDDILLAKLRPGQAIELEAHGRRGIGKDHAKFSPVATASYRLTPVIELLHDVYDELAEELVHVYEPGVFDLVPTSVDDPPNTRVKARVVNPYACTMSRNYMRNAQLASAVRMTRLPDHFIFSVESVGMAQPAVLIADALRVLQQKCIRLMELLDEEEQRR